MTIKKLTSAQKSDLRVAYEEAMSQTSNTYTAAHMFLIAKLNQLGYSVQSKERAFEVAESIIWSIS